MALPKTKSGPGHNKINQAFGYSAEQDAKQKSKWDTVQYNQVVTWMNTVLGKQLLEKDKDSAYLQKTLENGVILCEFINKIKANSVSAKIMKQMQGNNIFDKQRISVFVTKAKEIGLPGHSSFEAGDLRDDNNMTSVLNGLYSFGRVCHDKKIAFNGITAKAKMGNQAWSISNEDT
eukprot:CAMPEP_0202694950 /NCGR_PEP_ID=MMETSP1385-20130828/8672_1 /ASSEMBLY_ACC=CAM_ASM_000861 /TAXON_ID=933848 /ORGANISM="Elphidium margaritaceum" /LENGTH=175 /DNA_ID=CAMNT_0049350891 /DNA_START=34 /DNA_END=558 /DNA_ORIENTATION=+